jgi:tetratricopeptide (TPR) repeat protein
MLEFIQFIIIKLLGILLKMMSRPKEAVICHKIVYLKSHTNYDKSSALSLEGDALVLLGKNKKAIKKYKKALNLTKYQFSIYLPLSESYKEMEMSKKKWLFFLHEIEGAVDYWKNFDRTCDDYREILDDQKNSLLFDDVIDGIEYMKSDVYWAMYTAAEKCMFRIEYYLISIYSRHISPMNLDIIIIVKILLRRCGKIY